MDGMVQHHPLTILRLKKRQEFVSLAKQGSKFVTPTLIIQSAPNPACAEACRVGFTTSRVLGNAVKRNRIRRRLREAVRALFPDYARTGYDYVLIGRQTALAAPYGDIVKDLQRGLRKIHEPKKNTAP